MPINMFLSKGGTMKPANPAWDATVKNLAFFQEEFLKWKDQEDKKTEERLAQQRQLMYDYEYTAWLDRLESEGG
jgi:hypothetical protein